MLISFTKMHGLGNDFVVLDGVRQKLFLTPEKIRRLADRRFGIGCDQVLVVEPAGKQDLDVDFRYRIFNADGGEVEQCGNGARCFVRFVHDHGLTDKSDIAVQTLSGVIHPRLMADGQVSVNMGVPRFAPQDVPFLTNQAPREEIVYDVKVGEETVELMVVSLGNPHAVQRVTDVDRAPIATLGPTIEAHPQFPRRVNAGFMQVVNRTHIRLRVYERGAGETLACGSGACAAVAVGRRRGWLDDNVTVSVRGGELQVRWPGGSEPMWMTGPATTVFEGQIDLDKL